MLNFFLKFKLVVFVKESIIYFSVRYRIFELFCYNENFIGIMSMIIRLFSSILLVSLSLTYFFFIELIECR